MFDELIKRLKEEDEALGLCICVNCFGDREAGSYLQVLGRRRCLVNSKLLTDLGNGDRRC